MVCEVTLIDNTSFRIQESKVGLLGLADSCDSYMTLLFKRVLNITVKQESTPSVIKTGFTNTTGGRLILVYMSLIFLSGSLLLFTKLFSGMAGYDFGPYLVFFFQLMFFFFYVTTP